MIASGNMTIRNKKSRVLMASGQLNFAAVERCGETPAETEEPS